MNSCLNQAQKKWILSELEEISKDLDAAEVTSIIQDVSMISGELAEYLSFLYKECIPVNEVKNFILSAQKP